MASRPLILASASPRRRQLLALGGWAFELRPVDAVEIPHPGESPADFVRRMSQTKARLAAPGVNRNALIVAADTTVTIDGRILNKPADAREDRKSTRLNSSHGYISYSLFSFIKI